LPGLPTTLPPHSPHPCIASFYVTTIPVHSPHPPSPLVCVPYSSPHHSRYRHLGRVTSEGASEVDNVNNYSYLTIANVVRSGEKNKDPWYRKSSEETDPNPFILQRSYRPTTRSPFFMISCMHVLFEGDREERYQKIFLPYRRFLSLLPVPEPVKQRTNV